MTKIVKAKIVKAKTEYTLKFGDVVFWDTDQTGITRWRLLGAGPRGDQVVLSGIVTGPGRLVTA